MFQLLTETSVFVSLPNGCLCQVIGDPIVNLQPSVPPLRCSGKEGELCTDSHVVLRQRGIKRRCIAGYSAERPPKRLKSTHSFESERAASNNTNETEKSVLPFSNTLDKLVIFALTSSSIAPADILFARARMFYSRPSFVPHTSQVITGLPPKRRSIYGSVLAPTHALLRYPQSLLSWTAA